ncbi:hypothetical protein QR78_30450 [Methylobacterium indicum]|uniref:Uncharacterized protein n=1 Tax=Methylobacterium indicum TaxID=1775910 RepID=A0A0J6QHK2_9HYPH|nr:hypothetical protein QR78_30450 [Methylobacterium indicum]BCM86330.1 hypothetical protein mvi_47910 [Methylobacterium indicum]
MADGLTFHGLRHTGATQTCRLDFDTRTIAHMLGQETEDMTAHDLRETDLGPKLSGGWRPSWLSSTGSARGVSNRAGRVV